MTVVPKSSGAVEVGAASVSYNAVADGEKKMVGFSTEAPAFHSETAREHKRRVDYHYKEWFLFALVAAVGPVSYPPASPEASETPDCLRSEPPGPPARGHHGVGTDDSRRWHCRSGGRFGTI
jgi:hypothetical protein